MHRSFVLAEKTLGAPNFASCGHQTGALPPISALPIYPHTATAGDAQMRLPGPLTSPEPRRLGTARREPAGKELAEPSPASLPAHGRSKGRGPGDKWLFCPEWVLFLPKRIHIHSLAFLSILHMHMHSQSRVSIQQDSSSFKTLTLIQHHSPSIQCLCTFTP